MQAISIVYLFSALILIFHLLVHELLWNFVYQFYTPTLCGQNDVVSKLGSFYSTLDFFFFFKSLSCIMCCMPSGMFLSRELVIFPNKATTWRIISTTSYGVLMFCSDPLNLFSVALLYFMTICLYLWHSNSWNMPKSLRTMFDVASWPTLANRSWCCTFTELLKKLIVETDRQSLYT